MSSQQSEQAGQTASIVHGGDLGAARQLFPDAPEPFLDLSTGINPWPYPLPQFSPDVFARLPQTGVLDRLRAVAAALYRTPSVQNVVVAPGLQITLPMLAALVRPGRAMILAPTYGEYARAAALAGHVVSEVERLDDLEGADIAFLANPNNPDGRMTSTDDLAGLIKHMRSIGALLVVDEAFGDVVDPNLSLAEEVAGGNVVVLRSFGKFYGLSGVRLGFALTDAQTAARLNRRLGPWAVSGPAILTGAAALADTAWQAATRLRLAAAAERLDRMLSGSGLAVVGGTSLFRLATAPDAGRIFQALGRKGIFVRHFPQRSTWLRFGLPANEPDWQRLQDALAQAR